MSEERLLQILKKLQTLYKDAECSLNFKNPFELLIATILSAQCTDERVNKVTPALFKKYPDAQSMASADLADLERLVQSTGFYKNKAKSLKGASEKIISLHRGELPKNLEALVHLPGVGRKTANVVLGNAFGIPAGIVVDTHVKRLSFRLGLTRQTDPEKVEAELNKKIPEKYWIDFPHWMIQHGRRVCIARAPQCSECPIESVCPKKGVAKKFFEMPKKPKSISFKKLSQT